MMWFKYDLLTDLTARTKTQQNKILSYSLISILQFKCRRPFHLFLPILFFGSWLWSISIKIWLSMCLPSDKSFCMFNININFSHCPSSSFFILLLIGIVEDQLTPSYSGSIFQSLKIFDIWWFRKKKDSNGSVQFLIWYWNWMFFLKKNNIEGATLAFWVLQTF
jgi:hypothetical protein